jgi:hypothetical protein
MAKLKDVNKIKMVSAYFEGQAGAEALAFIAAQKNK